MDEREMKEKTRSQIHNRYFLVGRYLPDCRGHPRRLCIASGRCVRRISSSRLLDNRDQPADQTDNILSVRTLPTSMGRMPV